MPTDHFLGIVTAKKESLFDWGLWIEERGNSQAEVVELLAIVNIQQWIGAAGTVTT